MVNRSPCGLRFGYACRYQSVPSLYHSWPAFQRDLNAVAQRIATALRMPMLRVDFYVSDGTLLLGELTMGKDNCLTMFSPTIAAQWMSHVLRQPQSLDVPLYNEGIVDLIHSCSCEPAHGHSR